MRAGQIILDTYMPQPQQWCWRRDWHVKWESAWTLFWKFAYLNQMATSDLARLVISRQCGKRSAILAKPQVDLRDGAVFDIAVLASLLRVDQGTVREAFLFNIAPGSVLDSSDCLRWCVTCMSSGFHSPLFQLRHTRSCPLHGQMLVDRCLNCRGTIPYKLTKTFSKQPFTCPHCGFDMAPTIREDRPKILRLQAHEEALLADPLRFHRIAAGAELINTTDARNLLKHAARFGITAVRHEEVEITSSYAGFLTQVLKDVVPGAQVKRLGGRTQYITRHECGCSHLCDFHDDEDSDEADDTTSLKTESTVASDSAECLARLLDTYKALRRHLWRHVLKKHQRCIRSAAKSLWWNMHGKSTVDFCPYAMAFLRWRMFWEGCCAPRYLYVPPTKDLYGIVGWHLARPETIPSHWSRTTKAWVACHVFAASAMDCFGVLMRWSDQADSKASIRWDQPMSPVNYSSLWAVAGRDCNDKPAVVYVRSPPPERLRTPPATFTQSHWHSHRAQIAQLVP
ncbi:hypothetical protein [Massilia sp. TN1-12]|uniref:hypothetical protein n=1 Tax=Massilia paldalensis TaxID=3377675 RepID=UPI00385101AA